MLKQVIVVRKDLNMRKGKMIAQGAHASLRASWAAQTGDYLSDPAKCFKWPDWWKEWFHGDMRKIAVSVDSEQALLDIRQAAYEAKLPEALIKDAGLTEFKEPTYTAVAIGPGPAELIDKITGTLLLL